MIDLSVIEQLYEPPLTQGLSLDELLEWQVPQYPAHTQCVERFIKSVTEASKLVIGGERQDGYIHSTTFSRRENGKFNSKKDYKIVKKL